MATKITKLTQQQIDKLPAWVEKWIDIGLSTQPADFESATEAALRAYELCGLKQPMIVLRMGSPYAATTGGCMAWGILREFRSQVLNQVWGQVESQVRSQVWSQVESQVESQVWGQVGGQVLNQVWGQVRSQVRSQVGGQVESQVWGQVESQVRSQVWSQVESQVESQVWGQVGGQVESQVGIAAGNNRGGAFWSGWCSYISFLRDNCGWAGDTLSRFEIDETLTKSCGWVWWHESVLAISDRPESINRNNNGQLHSESGPSMAYRDGWKLWHINGIAVDEQIIMRPETQTVKQIDAEQNGDVRSIRIDRFGWPRYLKESGSIERDYRVNPISNTHEALYRTPKNEQRLVVSCPTGRMFALGVPSDVATCEQAQHWLGGEKKFNLLAAT
jgi:hypothetical protein